MHRLAIFRSTVGGSACSLGLRDMDSFQHSHATPSGVLIQAKQTFHTRAKIKERMKLVTDYEDYKATDALA